MPGDTYRARYDGFNALIVNGVKSPVEYSVKIIFWDELKRTMTGVRNTCSLACVVKDNQEPR